DLLGGNQDLFQVVAETGTLHLTLDIALDLVLLTAYRSYHIPFFLQNLRHTDRYPINFSKYNLINLLNRESTPQVANANKIEKTATMTIRLEALPFSNQVTLFFSSSRDSFM